MMSEKITEKDLEQIFIASRLKKKNPLWTFLKFVVVLFLVFAGVFFTLNYSAYVQKIKFWYRDEFASNDKPLSDIVLGPSDTDRSKDSYFPNIDDNSIFVERIDLKAPITFRVENEEKAVSNNLKNGVVHIADTSLPGENGNVFVTGHSSNYPWVSSKYNAVFALLDKEVVGDLVMIKFRGVNYIYQIEEKLVVGPLETSVMDNYAEYPTLTLMTCTPVGTNLKRLIIRAKQIIPDSSGNSGGVNQNGGKKELPVGVR
jgi:LPXTG-site transpeptidase (sortase) family protein